MQNLKSIYLVLCFILPFQAVQSQNDPNDEKIKSEMWSDPDFRTTEIPKKWESESAVILAKSYKYEAKKEVLAAFLSENFYFHNRIKLLDKYAINDFSELSFENNYNKLSIWHVTEKKDVIIGIKVIKPNGKENIVDLNEVVLDQIKEGIQKKEYKKIAIPDLEIGDIIDYFYVIKNTFNLASDFEPVLYKLVDKYPIVSQKIDVKILRKIFFNSKSINGAPELKPIDNEGDVIYSLVDNNREKVDTKIWTFPYRIYPTVIFQAFYITEGALSRYSFLNFFLKERKTNTQNIDLEHIDQLVDKIYSSQLFDYFIIDQTKAYLKKNFKEPTSNETLVKYAYYYLRQYVGYFGSNKLMLNLSKVLQYKDISFDLVITVPNYITDVSDLIIPLQMSYLLRIKGDPDYFIGDFSSISTFKSISNDYQGNTAYAIGNAEMGIQRKIEKIIIPIDNPEWNKQISNLHVKFWGNKMDSLEVKFDKTITGIGINDEIDLTVPKTNYLNEVEDYLNVAKSKDKKKNPRQQNEEKLVLDQQLKDCEKGLNSFYKYSFDAGDDFKIDSSYTKSSGIWDNSPGLHYNVCFKTSKLIKKIGPNYLVAIGKLITQQLELSKKELDRNVDIYAPYPRTFEYNISFEIPSGYNVKGLEKINININNSTGGFISKSEIKNNMLVINVKKYYSHNFEKAAEWSNMTQFIEAAYNYTQQNILLEKQNNSQGL